VDLQNDFIDGSMALKNSPARDDGTAVIPIINQLIHDIPFDLIVYTQDWHPANHISFYNNHKLRKLSEKTKVYKILFPFS
jgi:nicotinamidase-related amidase